MRPRLFAVETGEAIQTSPVDAVRAALAAVEPVPGQPKIVQRYSRAQTARARRGIALARQALEAA